MCIQSRNSFPVPARVKNDSKLNKRSHNSHNNCFLSGVYYPIGNKDFKISFYKNHRTIWNVTINKYNEFNSKKIIFEIKDNNTLILFPIKSYFYTFYYGGLPLLMTIIWYWAGPLIYDILPLKKNKLNTTAYDTNTKMFVDKYNNQIPKSEIFINK